jgi:hypothetical protein
MAKDQGCAIGIYGRLEHIPRRGIRSVQAPDGNQVYSDDMVFAIQHDHHHVFPVCLAEFFDGLSYKTGTFDLIGHRFLAKLYPFIPDNAQPVGVLLIYIRLFFFFKELHLFHRLLHFDACQKEKPGPSGEHFRFSPDRVLTFFNRRF